MSEQSTKRLLNKYEVEDLYGIRANQLASLVKDGVLSCVHVGRRVFYDRLVLDAFVESGGKVWFVDYSKGIVALDPATGKPRFKLDLHDAKKFTPIVLEGKLNFWSSDGWMIRATP